MDALFKGVCTALVTPFRLDFVNFPLLDRLLERQIQAGVQAVVVCGTTGEGAALTDEEKLELFSRAVKTAGGRCRIIAGTGSNNTSHSVELSCAARDAGVDGLLLVSPYYNKGTVSGLISHYSAIADAAQIPCILYNVPGRTGQELPLEVYRVLSEHPLICGTKEAGGSISKIARIRDTCGDRFAVWAGNDDQIVPVMALGGAGVISVLSNLYPETVCRMAALCQAQRYSEAGAMQCAMMPMIDALFSEVNPVPIKAAMEIIGFDVGAPRLPLSELSEEHRHRLKQLIGGRA